MRILTKKNRDGDTALILAVWKGHTDIAKALIDKGADVNAKDRYGNTTLALAAYRGHKGVVKALIDKGADIGMVKALQWAQNKGHTEIVQILEEAARQKKLKDILASASQPEHDSTPSAPPYPNIEAQSLSTTPEQEFWKPLPPEAPHISESQIPEEESISDSPRYKTEEKLSESNPVEEKDTEIRRKNNLHSPQSPRIVLPEDKTQTTNMPAANLTSPAASRQQIETPAAGIIRPAAEGKHAKRVRKQTSTPPSPKRQTPHI